MNESPVCGCCGRDEQHCDLRRPLAGWQQSYGLPPLLCSDCLGVWYDSGVTDPTEIKRRVLAQVGRGVTTGEEPPK